MAKLTSRDSKAMVLISLKIDRDVLGKIDKYAKMQHRSRNNLINLILWKETIHAPYKEMDEQFAKEYAEGK